MPLSRRQLLAAGGAAALSLPAGLRATAPRRRPNIILILADDLGYGDLGSYGARAIRTPHLDRLARQGVLLTDYYSPANICTPARAGLLTGRYPIRTGLGHQVIQAWDKTGLPLSEVTIAEALRAEGYATGLVGKWHLGHVEPFWPPARHGFDSFFGLPYSHNQRPLSLYSSPGPGVAYVKDDKVPLKELTRQFTDRAVAFIEEQASRPFFLFVSHTAPHLPLLPVPPFAGRSKAHAYGDVVEELDAGIGRILATLQRQGLAEDSLVIVTSDNGPWFEGSAGPLHDRKGGSGFDGGYRVPFIARYPRRIPAGARSSAIAMGIDLLPTILGYAGVKLPGGVTLDGRDISSVLAGGRVSPHSHLLLFDNENISGIRTQRWKLVTRSYYRTLDVPLTEVDYTPLFDMTNDPGEQYSAAQSHPELVAQLRATVVAEQKRFDAFRTKPPPPGLPPGYRERGETFSPEHQH